MISEELADRFGKLPPEVRNLLYAVRIKAMAVKSGIDSISVEHGEIIIRPFEGIRFDQHRLQPLCQDGIRLSSRIIKLNYRRLGKNWQKASRLKRYKT